MFTLASCPFCKQAMRFMDTLYAEDKKYKDIEIDIIDESRHPDIAGRYDYYYVPTYYIDGKKVHEGVASLKIVRDVFDSAL